MTIRFSDAAVVALFALAMLLSLNACDKGKTSGNDEDTTWTWERCTTEGWDTTDDTWHPCDSLLYLDVRAACEWEDGEEYQKMYKEDLANWRDNTQHWRGLRKLSPRIKEIYFGYYFHFEDAPNLTELPQEIWEIPHMWAIELRNLPKLKKIPDVHVSADLRYFRAESLLVPFPKGLTKTTLKTFEWVSSKLDTIPAGFRELAPQIRKMNFWNCSLDSLPEWIGEFKSASVINLGSNQLHSLPHSVVNWPGHLLRLDQNDIDSLPDDFCQYDFASAQFEGNNLCTIDVWPSCFDSLDLVKQMKYQVCN